MAKLKAAVTESPYTEELVRVINGMRPELIQRLAIPLLRFEKDPGPAAIFVQHCDFMDEDPSGLGCNVVLSDVTPNDKRSVQDLRDAIDTVADMIRRHIQNSVPIGQEVQLFVVLFLSEALPSGEQTLEKGPEWVPGAKSA